MYIVLEIGTFNFTSVVCVIIHCIVNTESVFFSESIMFFMFSIIFQFVHSLCSTAHVTSPKSQGAFFCRSWSCFIVFYFVYIYMMLYFLHFETFRTGALIH